MVRIACRDDIDRINFIVNSPEVKGCVTDSESEIDVSSVFDRDKFFLSDNGVIVAEPHGEREYLGLSAFLYRGWGQESIAAHREAMEYMFLEDDAERVWATVDPSNVRAARNLKAIGFKHINFDSSRIIASMDWMDFCLSSRRCEKASEPLPWAAGMYRHTRRMLGGVLLCEDRLKATRWFNRYAILNQFQRIEVHGDVRYFEGHPID